MPTLLFLYSLLYSPFFSSFVVLILCTLLFVYYWFINFRAPSFSPPTCILVFSILAFLHSSLGCRLLGSSFLFTFSSFFIASSPQASDLSRFLLPYLSTSAPRCLISLLPFDFQSSLLFLVSPILLSRRLFYCLTVLSCHSAYLYLSPFPTSRFPAFALMPFSCYTLLCCYFTPTVTSLVMIISSLFIPINLSSTWLFEVPLYLLLF